MSIRPYGGEEAANHSADEAAVRSLYEQLLDGWNNGSGDAFAAPFTDDGDLVAFDGTHFKGREEIAPFHQQLFDKWLKGTRLVGEVKDVRFLSPDVAVMHAVGSTVMRGKSEPSPERDSIQTLVVVREGGEWRLEPYFILDLNQASSCTNLTTSYTNPNLGLSITTSFPRHQQQIHPSHQSQRLLHHLPRRGFLPHHVHHFSRRSAHPNARGRTR